MLWWNWRILSNFQSGGLTEIYAGMLSLLPSIDRKSARSAAKVIAPRGKKVGVELEDSEQLSVWRTHRDLRGYAITFALDRQKIRGVRSQSDSTPG